MSSFLSTIQRQAVITLDNCLLSLYMKNSRHIVKYTKIVPVSTSVVIRGAAIIAGSRPHFFVN